MTALETQDPGTYVCQVCGDCYIAEPCQHRQFRYRYAGHVPDGHAYDVETADRRDIGMVIDRRDGRPYPWKAETPSGQEVGLYETRREATMSLAAAAGL